MDLPYPSQPDLDLQTNPVQRLDKRMRSTMWSMKQVSKNQQNLPQGARERLVRLVEKDRVWQLSRKLHDYGTNLETEVGVKGSRWTLLHYSARWNAVYCLEYLLREKYQHDQEEYLAMLNAKSIEGYSPLMVAILYDAKDFMQTLLQYGGVDIFLINNNRLTAYQLAVSNKNEHAIKLLVEYEQVNKHANYIDKERLMQPFMFPDEEKPCCCTGVLKIFYEWMLPQPKDKELFLNRESSLLTPKTLQLLAPERKSLSVREADFDPEFPRTTASICSDPEQLASYRISWERAEDLHHSDLFNSMNPFETRQNNLALKHQLIVVQALARQSWLVRQLAAKLPDRRGMYQFKLYHHGHSEKVTVDDFLPCLRDKKEPLFLLNKKELWPMLLQKAWVKPYGSYLKTLNVQPARMLYEMTGCPTQTFLLSDQRDRLFEKLSLLSKSGFVVVLTTKSNAKLREEGQGSESFSILNFYEKEGKKLCLVNCPFVLSKWKDKDRNEPLTLRVIKSHYKNDSQMSVWLDEERLADNFESFTVCYTSEHSVRSQIKGYSREFLFFKFQAPQSDSEEPYLFNLYEFDGKGDLREVSLGALEVSCDDFITKQPFRAHLLSFGKITALSLEEGEYFCKVALPPVQDPSRVRNLALVVHGPRHINLECIDEEIAKVEWLYLLKDKLLVEEFAEVQGDPDLTLRSEQFSNYSLILLRDRCQKSEGSAKHSLQYSGQGVAQLIQGYKDGSNRLLFESIDPHTSYLIFKLAEGASVAAMGIRYFRN